MKIPRRNRIPLLLAAALPACSAAADPDEVSVTALRPHAVEWERIVAAEDARARTPEQLETILEGTRSDEPAIRAMAVRSLGRLERADQLPAIAVFILDPSPTVRAAAVRAIPHAAFHVDSPPAREVLRMVLDGEDDPELVEATLEALGRLRHEEEGEAGRTVAHLLPHLDGPPRSRLAAVRGLYFLGRQPEGRAAFDAVAVAALRSVATSAPSTGETLEERRTRTVAVRTLVEARRADPELLSAVLADPHPLVRVEGADGLATLEDPTLLRRLALPALGDPSGVVRFAALRAYGTILPTDPDCDPVRAAARDDDAHVALHALDLLGTRCVLRPGDQGFLDSLAVGLPPEEDGAWHRAARALLSLAAGAPESAARSLPAFSAHPNLFVRSYAARAAARIGDMNALRMLAEDPHPNVRTAAVEGLHKGLGAQADDVYLAQLGEDDSQLLQTVAAALEGSGSATAPGALMDALDRVSAGQAETSRDARRALLVRAGELGSPSLAPRVEPYLRDFDPEIAGHAATALERWTGSRPEPAPTAPPPLPLPDFEEAAALASARITIEMADGARIELRLFPFEAPTNAARFARLARDGFFDGLTLHRVAPNFVVQGGSPHANEYTGDGPYTRDELARANWRGTVGLSTRGRDTGDGQLFFNLLDNVRLDTGYTIFAEVTQGMEHVDRLQEGAVMRTVRAR